MNNYNNSNGNFSGNSNQQNTFRPEYYGAGSDYSKGDNMLPGSFNECFYETKATENLKKWIKVFNIFCIVLFVLLIIYGGISGYNTAQIVKKVNTSYYPYFKYVKSFDFEVFLEYILGYGIAMFAYFLVYKLIFAVLNCIAQITRNTGISTKLVAFNTRNQMIKDASKENEDKKQ